MEATKRLLKDHKLRVTAVRQKVLEAFLAADRALGSSDLEEELSKVDRITLYRTLRSFQENGLIHQAMDSSGKNKYALCSKGCSTHQHHDQHAHFHCKVCGNTTCLDGVHVPTIAIPTGFQLEEMQLVLGGTCQNCNVQNIETTQN